MSDLLTGIGMAILVMFGIAVTVVGVYFLALFIAIWLDDFPFWWRRK